MNWLFYSLLSAIFFTIYALLSRILSLKSQNPRAFSVIFGTFAGLFSLILFIIKPFQFEFPTLTIVLLTILSTIFYSIYDRFQFYAYKYLEASVVIIVFTIIPVVTFLASLLFLGEGVTFIKLIAVSLIVGGNILVAYKNNVIKLEKGLLFALISASAIGLALTVDKKASSAYPILLYPALVYLIPALYNLTIPPMPLTTIKNELRLSSWKVAVLSALNLAAYYCVLKAFQIAEVSKVIPVSNSSTILVVLAGVVLLNERSHIIRKMIAAGLVFIGVVLINN